MAEKTKTKKKAGVKVKKTVRKVTAVKPAVKPKKVSAAKPALKVTKVTKPKPQKTILKKVEPPPVVKHPPKPPVQKVPPCVAPAQKVIVEAKPVEIKKETPVLKELEIKFPINVKDLAIKLQEKPSVLIKMLMGMGVMAGINQALEEKLVNTICEKFGFKVKVALGAEELALQVHQEPDPAELLKPRSPIVTFMGHVDHGKTSLLDTIRKTKVAESEHGGITQHIGAYRVSLPQGEISFLDTPGHEAFTAMRARGASVTDIVVLVVAADEGIMPQTKEAIDHARAAGVPIVVAVNKIDKPGANIDRVKKQLSEFDLRAEDWGGKTVVVGVSAKTGEGIDALLEMILLEAQMLELKANPKRPAKGIALEAKITKGRGVVATLLVQNGTLHLNENILVGKYYGRVRALFNDRGQPVTQACPSFAVEILGLNGVPEAGEQFFIIEDEKKARELALMREEKERQEHLNAPHRISLEDLYSEIKEGKLKELKLIIKADVQGSLEAIRETLNKLNVSEIKLSIIHDAAGTINQSDVILAVASNALILGFNITADAQAKELAAKQGIDIRTYNIIYELANDIKAALEGMLEPKLKKIFIGKAEIRKVLKLSRAGTVAGCYVSKGKIMRTSLATLLRNGEAVFEGKVSSLRRFKDDVREVQEGFECGITLGGFDALMEGDIIEAYEVEKIARKL